MHTNKGREREKDRTWTEVRKEQTTGRKRDIKKERITTRNTEDVKARKKGRKSTDRRKHRKKDGYGEHKGKQKDNKK